MGEEDRVVVVQGDADGKEKEGKEGKKQKGQKEQKK